MTEKITPEGATLSKTGEEVETESTLDEGFENGHSDEEVTTKATEAPTEPDWKTQAAYLAAEVMNMQKRYAREASEIRKYANDDLLKKLVPAFDNLSLALKAAAKTKDLPESQGLFGNKVFLSFLQGVEMTTKQFELTLASSGVEFIKSVGEIFDPTVHEAIGQTHTKDVPDNVITEEFERGFRLNGRIIRPAKVFVNKSA